MIGVSELLKQFGIDEIIKLSLKILCKSNKLNTFVNEWNFDKMPFMIDLRIDIRTKEMLNITPSIRSAALYNLLALS